MLSVVRLDRYPAAQRRRAAGMQPVGRRWRLAIQRIQRRALMIAHQIDRPQRGDRRPGDEQRDDTGTVRSFIDIVAEMDQPCVPDRAVPQVLGDGDVQCAQLRQAAVDVTNCVDTSVGAQQPGRADEV